MGLNLTYFEILGLDSPPEDRKALKRAYSKKLKVTRPEDDPEGFIRLREAHDLALALLARQADVAAWEARSVPIDAPTSPDIAPELTQPFDPSLTYQDLIPEQAPSPEPDTSYAMGPTRNLDAPVILQEPEAPQTLQLLEDLKAILGDPKFYNDRDQWNALFRKARQLDIDDYVDFEHSVLDIILEFHGYFDPKRKNLNEDRTRSPLSPSITASLFKTMSWDQVNLHGSHRSEQIEWLDRHINFRHYLSGARLPPQTNSVNTKVIWLWLLGAFVLVQILQLLANA